MSSRPDATRSAFDLAESISAELDAARFEVLYDDRPKVSPGVKFGDAELLGVPTIVIVGRGAADGLVELWDRRTNERTEVPAAELLTRLRVRTRLTRPAVVPRPCRR